MRLHENDNLLFNAFFIRNAKLIYGGVILYSTQNMRLYIAFTATNGRNRLMARARDFYARIRNHYDYCV